MSQPWFDTNGLGAGKPVEVYHLLFRPQGDLFGRQWAVGGRSCDRVSRIHRLA